MSKPINMKINPLKLHYKLDNGKRLQPQYLYHTNTSYYYLINAKPFFIITLPQTVHTSVR